MFLGLMGVISVMMVIRHVRHVIILIMFSIENKMVIVILKINGILIKDIICKGVIG